MDFLLGAQLGREAVDQAVHYRIVISGLHYFF
jgi:hypothetical protein